MIGNQTIKVLLLLQRPEAWINIVSLWEYLDKSENFSPEIWALPYNIEDEALSKRKFLLIDEIIREYEIPIRKWKEGDQVPKNCFDFVIFNHPYDRERPREFWMEEIKALVPYSIYIPYGPVMGGGYKNLRLQFCQPTQLYSSAIIARSGFEKALYRKYCSVGSQHVHVIGQPRFDYLIKELERAAPESLIKASASRLTVLWNSHFSFGWSYSQLGNFSTFDTLGPEIFELALANREELCLLWRPHPGLFPAIVREGLLTEMEIVLLRLELSKSGIILDESPDHIQAFKVADALLTDVGSFLLEFLVTRKPILALINPEGEPLNSESQSLVQHYARASTFQDVDNFFLSLGRDETDVSNFEEAVNEHLPLLDCNSAQRVSMLMEEIYHGRSLCLDKLPFRKIVYSSKAKVSTKMHTLTRKEGAESDGFEGLPTLERLVLGLRELRERKAAEPFWRKALRRNQKLLRTFIVEKMKKSYRLVKLSGYLR